MVDNTESGVEIVLSFLNKQTRNENVLENNLLPFTKKIMKEYLKVRQRQRNQRSVGVK